MDRVKIINYKGKEIVYADHRGLKYKELIEDIKTDIPITMELYKKKGGPLLGLFDFRETAFDNEVMDFMKTEEQMKASKCYRKGAVLGISGLRKAMLNVFNMLTGGNNRAFDSEEEAKEWLVEIEAFNTLWVKF